MIVENRKKIQYTDQNGNDVAQIQENDVQPDTQDPVSPSSHTTYPIPTYPLTKRQLFMWMGQQLSPTYPIYNMPMTFEIIGAIDPLLFQQAFQRLVQHTDILRTVFRMVDGEPRQIVQEATGNRFASFVTQSNPMFHFLEDDANASSLLCPFIDLSNQADPQAAFEQALTDRKVIPINLDERTFDSALFKLGQEQFIWYIALHHITVDAWSFSLLYQRMSEFYTDLAQGSEIVAPNQPLYHHYITHERAYQQSTQAERDGAYWADKLNRSTSPIPFYGNQRTHQSNKIQQIQRVVYDLGQERSEKLRQIADQQDVRAITQDLSLLTIFIMLTAAYTTRVSNQRQIPISLPFHNRSSRAFKQTIGLFMEICPLYADIEAEETFLSLLQKVRGELYTIMRHSQYSLSNGAYTDNQHRAFDLMVNYHNMCFPNFHGFSTKPNWLHSGYWDGDQSLSIQVHDFEQTGALQINFDFNRELFDEQTQKRAISHFLHMLDGFIQDQTQQIASVDILSKEERAKILYDFNKPVSEVSVQEDLQSFIQQFEAEAAQVPDQIAVVYQEERLTYEELNRQANQLAHYLRSLGVGPDTIVGLCLERKPTLLIGILGILKAGGAYLPLDPTYPKARLNFILDKARTSYLLTERVLVGNFVVNHEETKPSRSADRSSDGPSPQMDVICIDTDAELIVRQAQENPEPQIMLDHLAYVIYTSGSTGEPKGVMIPHRGLANYLTWAKEAYDFSTAPKPLKGSPVHSSISFDLTITSLFVPLLGGQAVELIPQGQEIEALGNALQRVPLNKEDDSYLMANNTATPQSYDLPIYNLVKITPAHLDTLKQQLLPEQAPSCTKAFIIGGEALHTEHIAFWLENAPDTVLINEYGPTETVVGCAVYRMSGRDTELATHQYAKGMQHAGAIPIGRPIANTQLYILDRHLQPVPIGVTGELYIAGWGLARGYLNQPALTAERFIPNPFGQESNERLYKTGDLARYLPDGNIEFLGRFDHQVKIRGYRIELGEVEAVLSQHPAVKACTISPKVNRAIQGSGRTNLDKRLVAYIVPEEVEAEVKNEGVRDEGESAMVQPATLQPCNSATLISDLRRHLNTRLPSYMVPSAFLFVSELPLTHNGKVDRRALPDPDWCQPELGNQFVSPRTIIEVRLAELWARILNLKKVGIHDNFFDLGGHSLLAMRLLSFIQLEFGIEMPLAALFGTPTVADIAPLIVQKQLENQVNETHPDGSFEKRSSTW